MSGKSGRITSGTIKHQVTRPGVTQDVESYNVHMDDGADLIRTRAQLAPFPAGVQNLIPAETVNPHPLGGGTAGANAAAVLAGDIAAGTLTEAQQISKQVAGLPEKGSLEWQYLVNAGAI